MTPARTRSPYGAILLIILVPLLFHLAIMASRHVPVALTAGGLFKLSFVTAAALMHWVLYAT
ncbi:MAG: hypothetical protein KGH91_09405, partial [Rhodospirillales bacterium]|nr:hypothetical protein [Rhodospirillales bacterium]